MLTRVLFIVLLICGAATPALAEEAKVLALGLADREVTEEELAKATPPVPGFNTPAIAYVLAANLKKGDTVEIALCNDEKPLLTNTETLAEDRGDLSAASGQAGRAGRRLAVGVEIFRQAQDHPRWQDADRAEPDADPVRVGSLRRLHAAASLRRSVFPCIPSITIHIPSIWMENEMTAEIHRLRERQVTPKRSRSTSAMSTSVTSISWSRRASIPTEPTSFARRSATSFRPIARRSNNPSCGTRSSSASGITRARIWRR